MCTGRISNGIGVASRASDVPSHGGSEDSIPNHRHSTLVLVIGLGESHDLS